MIITRTPYRISLFGGSTDYKEYYEKYGSLLVGFTIDKYVYVCLKKNDGVFDYKTRAVYSIIDDVQENSDIKNPGIRGVLSHLGILDGLSISVQTDLPSQVGMGSSSSLIVGLLKAIYASASPKPIDKEHLVQTSVTIERDLLQEAGGCQDSIWAVEGGVNSIHINKKGNYIVRPLPVSKHFLTDLRNRMVLAYVGGGRKSFEVAASHNNLDAKHKILGIAHEGLKAFAAENIDDIGGLLHHSWQAKKSLSDQISNPGIDDKYAKGLELGAIGAKLLGSGQGGFILYVLHNTTNKLKFIEGIGLTCIDFSYSYGGSEVLLQ